MQCQLTCDKFFSRRRHFVDLDVAEDLLEKTRAIIAGEEYDTRVCIQITFSDEELLTYMKLAHELDITFNEFVIKALQEMMDKHEDWDEEN